MPETDLSLLQEAARAAGEIALRHRRHGVQPWNKPDGGPVTKADLEIDAMLRDRLTAARPDYGWLSEESDDDVVARQGTARVFIVDPIDGTRAFAGGDKSFGHALAVVEDGQVIAGVVHMPALGKTYGAAHGGGAACNDAPIRAVDRDTVDGATVVANSAVLNADRWSAPLPVNRHFRPSLAYRICMVAEGRFDAAITLRPAWEWDTAAACLIAAEAGAAVTDGMGGPIRFNAPSAQHDGLIVAGPTLHAELVARRR